MSSFSTPAILLRRTDYGDFDLILSFFSLNKGKISLFAKSAKRSKKRFAGVLELFSVLDIVASTGRRGGLSILQEATLQKPFSRIRADIITTAYASYWVELVHSWTEENVKQNPVFFLLQDMLQKLDAGEMEGGNLSILFQMRLLNLSGHRPNLNQCNGCGKSLADIRHEILVVDVAGGGIICSKCSPGHAGRLKLSKGTIKQLLWVESGDLAKACRIKFSGLATREGLEFLEIFVPYHLGKQPKSLKFLRQIRK